MIGVVYRVTGVLTAIVDPLQCWTPPPGAAFEVPLSYHQVRPLGRALLRTVDKAFVFATLTIDAGDHAFEALPTLLWPLAVSRGGIKPEEVSLYSTPRWDKRIPPVSRDEFKRSGPPREPPAPRRLWRERPALPHPIVWPSAAEERAADERRLAQHRAKVATRSARYRLTDEDCWQQTERPFCGGFDRAKTQFVTRVRSRRRNIVRCDWCDAPLRFLFWNGERYWCDKCNESTDPIELELERAQSFPQPAQVAMIAPRDDWYEQQTALVRAPAALNWSYERGHASVHRPWREGRQRNKWYRGGGKFW